MWTRLKPTRRFSFALTFDRLHFACAWFSCFIRILYAFYTHFTRVLLSSYMRLTMNHKVLRFNWIKLKWILIEMRKKSCRNNTHHAKFFKMYLKMSKIIHLNILFLHTIFLRIRKLCEIQIQVSYFEITFCLHLLNINSVSF